MNRPLLISIAFIFTFIIFPIFCWSVIFPEEQAKLTDDLYIEIKAQINFAADQAFKQYDGMEAVKKAEEAYAKIYEKYGVTKEEMEAYLTEISEKDVKRATDILMKVARRTQELNAAAAGEKTAPEPVSGESEVRGFPVLPLYPGAEAIAGTEMGETEWTLDKLREEGYIWYEYGKKLCEEYNEDPQGIDQKIVDFYKEKLAQKGWTYVGEGVRTHHWIKGDAAIGISFPVDCTVEYRRMSVNDAKGNCGQLNQDDFIKAIFTCVEASQEICKESDILNIDDYQTSMADEESYENLKKKLAAGLNQALIPYGVTFKRLKEIKEDFNFDEIMGRIYSENEEKVNSLQLGFMVLMEMME